MTTQELKQYIDKVLGNNIRCLLPSYWWKRLFSLTLDKVDEKLDAANIKTINGESVIGEGDLKVGVKSVGTVEELEKLNAELGDIATVGTRYVGVSFRACRNDNAQTIDDITRVLGVEVSKFPDITDREIVFYNAKTERPEVSIRVFPTGRMDGVRRVNGYVDTNNIYVFSWDGKTIDQKQVDAFNKFLQSGDYRFYPYKDESVYDFLDTFIKCYIHAPSADAYIKSDSWEKLSKEYVVSSEEELNRLSVPNGTIAKVARELKQINRANCHTINIFSDIPSNWDKFTHVDKVEHIGSNTSKSCGINLAHYDGHNYVVLRINFAGSVTYVSSAYVDSTMTNEESITKAEVDVMLKEYDFRYIGPTFTSGEPYIDSTFILYEKDVFANAYIKGETWKRLLKEGDVVGGGPEILELTIGETEEDRANNVKIYNKIVEAFNSDDINIPMISVGGMLVSNVSLSGIEGEAASLNVIADYISFKVILSLSLTKTGEVEIEDELQYSSYCFLTSASSMVNFAKCVAAGLLPNVLYIDPRQGLVIADTFNSEGDNIVLYFNLSKGRTKVVVSSETGEILSEEVVSSGEDITIDSELSDTSTNAVQNKAVKAYVDEKTSNNSYAIVLASEGFNMSRYGKDGSSLGKVYIKPNVPTRVYATTFAPNGSTGRIKSIKLSHLDTQGATDMGFMFGSRDVWQNVEELDLSYIDTSSATVMDNFVQLPKVTKLDVTSFDTSNVVNMSCMFRFCENLTDIDVSNFDTSKVLYFDSMFNECKSLKSLDLSNFNTSSATTMSHMFWYCEDLEYLNLSSFDTSNIETLRGIYGMFFGCGSIKTLILGENFFRVAAPIEGDGLQYMNTADFSGLIQWTDESVVTSLVTNSYDRIANGLSEINLSLSSQTMAVLTDEHKAIIAAKGYILQ
jgi:surface protein